MKGLLLLTHLGRSTGLVARPTVLYIVVPLGSSGTFLGMFNYVVFDPNNVHLCSMMVSLSHGCQSQVCSCHTGEEGVVLRLLPLAHTTVWILSRHSGLEIKVHIKVSCFLHFRISYIGTAHLFKSLWASSHPIFLYQYCPAFLMLCFGLHLTCM